jgi:hypothetical protein
LQLGIGVTDVIYDDKPQRIGRKLLQDLGGSANNARECQ